MLLRNIVIILPESLCAATALAYAAHNSVQHCARQVTKFMCDERRASPIIIRFVLD